MRQYPCAKSTLKAVLVLGTILVFVVGCAGLPEAPKHNCNKIQTGVGPEDFVFDEKSNRILVSSQDRRKWLHGEIYATNLDDTADSAPRKIKRIGEPPSLFFSPHGLDLRTIGKDRYLYVINHGQHRDKGPHHVVIYKLKGDDLHFQTAIASKVFSSPNDLAIDAQGGFYVSNDSATRNSFWEIAFALKKASVAYCPSLLNDTEKLHAYSKPKCFLAATKLAYANGVAIKGNSVFISTSRGNSLYQFQRSGNGGLSERRKIFSAPGLDNLFLHNTITKSGTTSELLVSSHPDGLAFFRHFKNSSVASPSVIYAININTNRSRILYADSGKEVSAASGAFILDNRLFISQVFEPYLLSCKME